MEEVGERVGEVGGRGRSEGGWSGRGRRRMRRRRRRRRGRSSRGGNERREGDISGVGIRSEGP